MNVVLIGMKHCGKSTLGQALARRWGCAFFDVDPRIEGIHACETGEGLSVREILSHYGEDHFHRIEGHVVCELYLTLDRPGAKSVVALGGRTALNRTIVELLKAIGLIVYLHVDEAELFRRVERSGLPPFLGKDDPRAEFHRLYREREPRYRELAGLVVNLDGVGLPEAVDVLAGRIEEHTHAGQ
jgi:shikimate kinase